MRMDQKCSVPLVFCAATRWSRPTALSPLRGVADVLYERSTVPLLASLSARAPTSVPCAATTKWGARR